MAKSLRSKFKRKMRAIARVKKAPKEAARLEEAVRRGEQFNATPQAVADKSTSVQAKKATELEVEKMETDVSASKATINLRTMKLANGKFPNWLNPRQRQKYQKKAKNSKGKKKKGIKVF